MPVGAGADNQTPSSSKPVLPNRPTTPVQRRHLYPANQIRGSAILDAPVLGVPGGALSNAEGV